MAFRERRSFEVERENAVGKTVKLLDLNWDVQFLQFLFVEWKLKSQSSLWS